jgi:hypothetical protein
MPYDKIIWLSKGIAMEKVFNIFGKLLATFYGMFNDMLGGIFIFALLVYMCMFFVNNQTLNNIYISELIKDDFDKTRKKTAKDKKKADNDTMKLLMSYGYSGFIGPFSFILKSLFGVLMAFGISSEPMANSDKTIFNIDTSKSLLALRADGSKYLLAVIGLAIAAIFVQLLHDGYIERKILMDQSAVDVLQLIPLTAMCILVPCGFIFYHILYTIVEIVQVVFQTTTMHDSGIKRFQRTMNYKKTTFDRRYEEQVRNLNEKKKNK